MTPDVAGPLALLDLAGTALAVAGSIAGAIALFRFFTTVGRIRRYKGHVRDEQSQNTKSLRGTLLGCREAIDTARGLESREAHFRSIVVLSITLQGALTRHETHIAHNARHTVRLLSLLLLDAGCGSGKLALLPCRGGAAGGGDVRACDCDRGRLAAAKRVFSNRGPRCVYRRAPDSDTREVEVRAPWGKGSPGARPSRGAGLPARGEGVLNRLRAGAPGTSRGGVPSKAFIAVGRRPAR